MKTTLRAVAAVVAALPGTAVAEPMGLPVAEPDCAPIPTTAPWCANRATSFAGFFFEEHGGLDPFNDILEAAPGGAVPAGGRPARGAAPDEFHPANLFGRSSL